MSGSVLTTTSAYGEADPGSPKLLADAGLAVFGNPFARKLTEAEVAELLARHRPVGLIAGMEPLTAKVLEGAAAHLKVVSRVGMGLDSVDREAARRLGIAVFNTPDAPSQAVAELAVALMLAALRRVAEADRLVRSGGWKPLLGGLLGGKTVGIVGYGRIGRRVADLVRAFGCAVLGSDPAGVPPGVEGVGLDELLERSDVVTLHLPAEAAAGNLLSSERLGRMRPGAVLVNAARGGLVDEAALADALKSGRLAAAGIDAFETEPYAGPLKGLPNAVLTCHMGSAAVESKARMEREAAENLLKGLKAVGAL